MLNLIVLVPDGHIQVSIIIGPLSVIVSMLVRRQTKLLFLSILVERTLAARIPGAAGRALAVFSAVEYNSDSTVFDCFSAISFI